MDSILSVPAAPADSTRRSSATGGMKRYSIATQIGARQPRAASASQRPSASVVTIGRTVNRPTRTVDVIYALRQPDERLRVGGMVRVGVPTGAPWQGVVVPRGAVLEDDGRAVVYVQVEGEAFEERTVRLGPRSGTRVGIERGIDANERVVTYGANVIRLASRASTAPAHGHVH